MSTASMNVSISRIRRDIEHLSTIGQNASGGVSRTSFSEADKQVRQWLREQCDIHGLEMRTDGIGNVVIRLPNAPSNHAPVWTGSHLDTVPDGGHYDGILGAVAGLEVMRVIAEHVPTLARPVEAVVFADE